MKHLFRIEEYKVLILRILLVYLFYGIARVLFLIYNNDALQVESISEFLKIYYHGLAFDTTAILYVNSLFIVLSLIPFWINTKPKFQKVLFYLYFISNLTFYATNFVDLIYYKFTYARTTLTVWDSLKHEQNLGGMFFRFLLTYWHVFLLFFVCAWLWIYLYKKIKLVDLNIIKSKFYYYFLSFIAFLFFTTMIIGGIRGDFKKSTRPINLVDANRHVTKMAQADLVLNTPFALLRTLSVKTFKKTDFIFSDKEISQLIAPIKKVNDSVFTKPNIVLFITESMGREYLGSFNKNMNIPDYVSYTPFLDSLAQHSLIFDNAYANGQKSIHGMSSILAGIPSFKDAFTSSPYSKQPIQSLVSILNEKGYDTSFYHGAPNGSMGFLGFGNILGFDHYYGKTEFNDDSQFDGSWGIWDEPFLKFMKETMDTKKGPFFSTVFTVTSHEPYVIPEEMEGKFPKGNIQMHQCVGYTDYAFKRFFEEAKKEPWFENTIFVLTADHGNQVYYGDEYYKQVNRQAVPILFYSPKGNLKGLNSTFAQQIDIYPTIIDLIGYEKPIRSWGRSLLNDTQYAPFVMNYNGNNYQYISDKYICIFDGQKAIGFYDSNDKGLTNNLIANRNAEMNLLERKCKAFLTDYFNRIIDKKL